MAVKIRNKQSVSPVVEKDVDKVPPVHRVIDSMVQVDAVLGLREAIERQQKRVKKLEEAEHLLPGVLPLLTNESRLLKDMYNDVIRFQTSASVLSYLRDNMEHRGLVKGALAYHAEASLRDEVQAATLEALELLAIKSG